MTRRLVAAIACRNQGSRLYAKPLQNLDIERGIRVIDNVIACLQQQSEIDEIVLGIADGGENDVFKEIARSHGLRFIIGDERDVLARLIQCGQAADATDIFRVTSESPFVYFDAIGELWDLHQSMKVDATFMDEIIDGCGFEILRLGALVASHQRGADKHRSELCTLYIREHPEEFRIQRAKPPLTLIRHDLRLTVDNPEDLVVCRAVFKRFSHHAPLIPVPEVVTFLDEHSDLVRLTAPYTDAGYQGMYL